MENGSHEPPTASPFWPVTHVVALSAVCLIVGLVLGYFLRGSAPAATTAKLAAHQTAVPASAGTMPAAMSHGTAPHPAPTLYDMKRMADTLNQLGILYRATHQFKEAEGYYEKALQVDPKNVNVRTDLASCLYYTGDVDGALAQLQKSLTYDPKHAGTLMNIGIIEWKGKNDTNAAVAAREKLLKLNPDFPQKEMVEHMIAEAKG